MSVQKRVVLRIQPRCQATLTQPLHCVLRHHVANLHVSTHVATSDDDNHAASPMRSATTIQETNRATHTGTTTRCRTQRRNQNDRSRTRHTQEVPFIAACSHFTRKNARFSFVLRLPPQHKRHHFPSPPLPFLTTSLRHHFPRSPLPFVTTLCHSLLFSCDVSLCDVKSHTALHQCQVSQFYLSVTRKYCFPTSFENHLSLSS